MSFQIDVFSPGESFNFLDSPCCAQFTSSCFLTFSRQARLDYFVNRLKSTNKTFERNPHPTLSGLFWNYTNNATHGWLKFISRLFDCINDAKRMLPVEKLQRLSCKMSGLTKTPWTGLSAKTACYIYFLSSPRIQGLPTFFHRLWATLTISCVLRVILSARCDLWLKQFPKQCSTVHQRASKVAGVCRESLILRQKAYEVFGPCCIALHLNF